MMRKTGGIGKDKRGDELPEELAFRERRLEKIREAMAALEAEAQAAAEQAEAEGGKHPGVPDDKAQRRLHRYRVAHHPRAWRKGLPASVQLPGGGGQRSPGDRGVARATNQTSDKQQAAAMMEETIDNVGAVPRDSIRRCWLLLGKGSRRALCSGPTRRRARSRYGCATRAREVAFPAI